MNSFTNTTTNKNSEEKINHTKKIIFKTHNNKTIRNKNKKNLKINKESK